MKEKSNNLLRGVWLAAVFSILSVILTTSVTYARYSTSVEGYVGFTAEDGADYYVVSLDEAGNKLSSFDPEWAVIGGEQYITFAITNSDGSDDIPAQDIKVRISVFVPEQELSALALKEDQFYGNLVFTLELGNNPASYTSDADYLDPLTPMYKEYEQSGWVYTFCESFADDDGTLVTETVSAQLKGGAVSDVEVFLAVNNTEIDCSSFRVIVDRIS